MWLSLLPDNKFERKLRLGHQVSSDECAPILSHIHTAVDCDMDNLRQNQEHTQYWMCIVPAKRHSTCIPLFTSNSNPSAVVPNERVFCRYCAKLSSAVVCVVVSTVHGNRQCDCTCHILHRIDRSTANSQNITRKFDTASLEWGGDKGAVLKCKKYS